MSAAFCAAGLSRGRPTFPENVNPAERQLSNGPKPAETVKTSHVIHNMHGHNDIITALQRAARYTTNVCSDTQRNWPAEIY